MSGFDPEFRSRAPQTGVDHCILVGALFCFVLFCLSAYGVIRLAPLLPLLLGVVSFLAGLVTVGVLRMLSIDGNGPVRSLLNRDREIE